MSPPGNENIRGLDIAVHDTFGVCGVETIHYLNGQINELLLVSWAGVYELSESFAIKEFHCKERTAIVFAGVVDGADIRVIQRGSGASFATESLQQLGILGHLVRQEFEGNEAAETRVLRFVDHAHASTTKRFEYSVVGNDFTDHVCWRFAPCGHTAFLWIQSIHH